MADQAELLKGSTDTLLLALLREEAKYGYQVIRELRERSDGYFRLQEGTIYPALHRLEQDGLVQASWQAMPSGPMRRYYRITENGIAVLEARVREWQQYAIAVRSVLVTARL